MSTACWHLVRFHAEENVVFTVYIRALGESDDVRAYHTQQDKYNMCARHLPACLPAWPAIAAIPQSRTASCVAVTCGKQLKLTKLGQQQGHADLDVAAR